MPIESIIVKTELDDKLTAPFKKQIALMEKLNKKQKAISNQAIALQKKITQTAKNKVVADRVHQKYNERVAKSQSLSNNMMSMGAQRLVDNSKRVNKLGKRYDSFGKVMKMPLENWTKFNKEGGEFNSRSAKTANSIRKMTHGFRGFKMEMLSVMFFGMSITRMVGGLLKPALQATGVFEIFGAALTILFLPVAMQVMDWAVMFLEWVSEMSPETKTLIKWITMIAYGLGAFLTVVGSVVLGLGGVIMAFGGMIAMVVSVVTSVMGLIFNWKSLIAVLLGFGLASKVVDAFGGYIEKAKGFMGGLLDKIIQLEFVQSILDKLGLSGTTFGEVWESAVTKFKELWEKVPETIKQIFNNIQNEFWTWYYIISYNVKKLVNQFMEMGGKDMVKNIGDLSKSLSSLSISLEDLVTIGNIVLTVFNGIAAALKKIDQLMLKTSDKLSGVAGTPLARAGKGGYRSGRQTGGYIPHDGLYKLHAGETVNQSNTSNFSPTMNINASSNVDIEQLKSQLSEQWSEELDRLSRR